MNKHFGKSLVGFRKYVAVKQWKSAFLGAILITLIGLMYSISSVNVAEDKSAAIMEAVEVYAVSVIVCMTAAIIMLCCRKKAEKHWRLMEICTMTVTFVLPFWGIKMLAIADPDIYVTRVLFWVVCMVGFSCISCFTPAHMISVMLMAVVMFAVLCGKKMGTDELINAYILMFACAWSSFARFSHEYETYKSMLDKDAYHARLTHEIRTPINAVIGTNELIAQEASDPRIKEYSEDISSASNMLLSIVNDILDISKLESGRMKIVEAEYSLSEVCKELQKMISYRAENNGLDFYMELDGSLPNKLIGDEIRVKQVVMNLLTNAVKYTDKGSVTLKVTGKMNGENADIAFSVKDTGIGIKPEDMKRLQDDFFRVEGNRNHRVEGTGLGLNIVNMLLGAMDGDLRVTSEYGAGSEFTAIIPQKVAAPDTVGSTLNEKKTEEHKRFEAPGTKVLVVDDNALNRKVFEKLLAYSKVTVVQAAGGREMLELVRKEKYDLIFLDHQMPKMDGIETIAEFRKTESINSSVKVIALTANEPEDAKEYYGRFGFADYLSKPIDIRKIEEIFKKYILSE